MYKNTYHVDEWYRYTYNDFLLGRKIPLLNSLTFSIEVEDTEDTEDTQLNEL
jgi:hypothetical protein